MVLWCHYNKVIKLDVKIVSFSKIMLTLSTHILWLYDWNNEYCNFYRVAQFTSIVTATVLFGFLKKLREKCCRLSLKLGNIVRVWEYLTAAESSSTALWLWASDRRFSVARLRRSLPLCCSASHESIPSSRPTSQTEHSALSHLYPSPPPWPAERGVAQEGSESRHKLQNGQTEHEKLQRVTDERGKNRHVCILGERSQWNGCWLTFLATSREK